MRDIFITLLILGATLFAFTRPWFGLALYVFVSVGVPHRMTWGFARELPFAYLVAIVTLLALVFSHEPKRFPITGLTVAMLAFFAWMTISTLFALEPEPSWEKWQTVMKIMFMVFVALVIVREQKHIEWLIGALVLTVGFYGVKGGFWTLVTGGSTRIYGPPGGFISENNSAALAIVMTIPLIYYFYLRVNDLWIKRGLLLMMILCSASVLGSHSRGALLAISAMAVMLWWKSKQKVVLAVIMILLVLLFSSFMPEHWHQRMATIQTYEEDSSAMGRLEAWETMFNIARDRPWVGGGFSVTWPWIFHIYAPNPQMRILAAHSIYFGTLGEHGFVGLGIYLMIGWLGLRTADKIIRATERIPDLRWANDLARMIKVSLVGFAVGGTFLNMQYFEMPYFLMVALVGMRILVDREARTVIVQSARC
jgi:probable O-glycosylation ligase (exosortase A-associated)